ncbi:MAG: hypothetical protein JWO69_205 [Thermoleophilia bacterium]|jgi:hypothetical protein|nr:hypothetical protein [Thermoleophilia bacterium]
MCTAVLRLDPAAAWPILLAFVRDEDRTRASRPPARWWPQQPSVIGGQDATHGGTWLGIDTDRAAASFVLNRLDPVADPIDPARRISRGTLPLAALAEGDLPSHADLSLLDPFNLVLTDAGMATVWTWTGAHLERRELGAGLHLLTSAGVDVPDDERQRLWAPRFDAARADPTTGWQPWKQLLDGAGARVDDSGSIVVAGVSRFPIFGTVGATLLGIARDGAASMEFNATHDLRPDSWEAVATD